MTKMMISSRRQCPGHSGVRASAVSTRPPKRRGAQPPLSWLVRSTFKLALILSCCHWHSKIIIFAAAAAADPMDEKSLAMANRLIQKMKDYENPPPSWNMMLQVLQNSFLNVPDEESNFYQSSPHEEKGRESALHWLAHEDNDTLSNISEGEYDRGLLQRYVLATIYFSTGGDDSWTRCSRKKQSDIDSSSSSTSISICESDEERYLSPHSHLKWTGINGKDGKLTWLDLTGHNLVSPTFLPLEVTLLSPSLELLWVSENESLRGELPEYLGEFTSLASLSAYKTSVGGGIPESIYGLPKLTSLRLYKSKFSGMISKEIEKLEGLKWFWVHENELTGEVPEEIGKLSNLEGATLHGNKFTPVESKNMEKSENEDGDGTSSSGSGLESNIIPEALCALRKKNLKHLWTDCEKDSLTSLSTTPVLDVEGAEKVAAGGFVAKEGVKACSCCTRCFPQKEQSENAIAVVAKAVN